VEGERNKSWQGTRTFVIISSGEQRTRVTTAKKGTKVQIILLAKEGGRIHLKSRDEERRN